MPVRVRSSEGLGVTLAPDQEDPNEMNYNEDTNDLCQCCQANKQPLWYAREWTAAAKEGEHRPCWQEEQEQRPARMREAHAGREAKDGQGKCDDQRNHQRPSKLLRFQEA